MKKIGILGAGTMGRGIAQLAATYGHIVTLVDTDSTTLKESQIDIEKRIRRWVEKNKLSNDRVSVILERLSYARDPDVFEKKDVVIEAIIEDIGIKRSVFQKIESIVSNDCLIASNTSSLSITSIASALKRPERALGIHFFNPAPIMPLVEIIPAVQTDANSVRKANTLIKNWKKQTVIAKDTPGFIVNKVARPFYSEALQIYEEGIASISQIDTSMRSLGFRMGPFELMDFIGNDVNYAVTESVFSAFYYDPRYRPSLTQRRLVDAQWLGKKTGRGYYNYHSNDQKNDQISLDLQKNISERILCMLINEAYDTAYKDIASKEDIDLAMQYGVNYPKGLFEWAKELGINYVCHTIDALFDTYKDSRYRCCPLLKQES